MHSSGQECLVVVVAGHALELTVVMSLGGNPCQVQFSLQDTRVVRRLHEPVEYFRLDQLTIEVPVEYGQWFACAQAKHSLPRTSSVRDPLCSWNPVGWVQFSRMDVSSIT